MKLRYLLLTPLALAIAACGSDPSKVTIANNGPLAYIRYVHAMPDTGSVTVRSIDRVENLPFNLTGPVSYKNVSAFIGVAAGQRHFKVFTDMGSTDINVIGQVMLDTTVTLTENTYYTILHTGYARTGQTPKQRWVLIQETLPSPTTTQVAIRSIVAAPGLATGVDVRTASTTAATSTTGTAILTNVVYGTPSAWVNVSPAATLAVRVFPTGTSAADCTGCVAQLALPAGAAQQTSLDPVAGVSVGGTALTAFVFPAGVAGSPAAGAASVNYGVDKRPPRT